MRVSVVAGGDGWTNVYARGHDDGRSKRSSVRARRGTSRRGK